ncbi:MAG: anti-sigma factor domain-containing protein [Peptococcaceae bacterium]|nr:anti-sigma factor domain-containing protein [Peptococcaceae bacterium]
MPDKRGTVIKVSGNRAFIMNEQCEFVEIKTETGLQAGDRIVYSPGDIIRARHYPVKWLALAASFILVCLFAFVVFKGVFAGRAYAYVGLDINPSIVMGVDKGLKVVSLTGYNEEGKRIIENNRLLKSGVDEALKVIIRECRVNNYLGGEKENDIALSVHIPGEAGSRELLVQLGGMLGSELAASGINARTYLFSIDQKTWQEAREKKVSAVKYLLWEEAGKRGYSPSLQEISLRDPRISSLALEVGEKIPGTFPAEGAVDKLPAGGEQAPRQTDGQTALPLKQDHSLLPRSKPQVEGSSAAENAVKKNEQKTAQPAAGKETPESTPEDGQKGNNGAGQKENENQEKKENDNQGKKENDNLGQKENENQEKKDQGGSSETGKAGANAGGGNSGGGSGGGKSGSGGGGSKGKK